MNTHQPEPAEPETKITKPEPGLRRDLLEGIFSWLILPITIVAVVNFFVIQTFHVVGGSMVPTLQNSDYLIINKLGPTKAMAAGVVSQNKTAYTPKRNEIIVFKYPKDPNLVYVKRVIGLPGDRIVIKDGQVSIYNSSQPEGFDPNTGYLPSGNFTYNDTDMVIPQGTVYVIGDNRSPGGSSDSRDWGVLPVENIIGDVVLRLIPLNGIRSF
ncbi:MAG TPA: signal peptidase I [Candidatus Dormibacteraeota bacterium]|nr:signal peptidase I [Candidatus Dormibacteraeota bacterium]